MDFVTLPRTMNVNLTTKTLIYCGYGNFCNCFARMVPALTGSMNGVVGDSEGYIRDYPALSGIMW